VQILNDYIEVLNASQANAITNYGDLYLEFYADQSEESGDYGEGDYGEDLYGG
jgi:hypothetical protein